LPVDGDQLRLRLVIRWSINNPPAGAPFDRAGEDSLEK